MTSQKNLRVRPGHDNLVALSAVDVQANEDIREEDADTARNCYFEDEYQLSVHKSYTQANCILECQVQFAVTHMGNASCIPWYQ